MEEWLLDTREQCKHEHDDDDDEHDDDDEVGVNDSAAPNITVAIDDIGPDDSVSNVGGKTCSSACRSSHTSSRSSSSSVCLKAEAERAGLLAMATALKEKHELEAQEEQIRKKGGCLNCKVRF